MMTRNVGSFFIFARPASCTGWRIGAPIHGVYQNSRTPASRTRTLSLGKTSRKGQVAWYSLGHPVARMWGYVRTCQSTFPHDSISYVPYSTPGGESFDEDHDPLANEWLQDIVSQGASAVNLMSSTPSEADTSHRVDDNANAFEDDLQKCVDESRSGIGVYKNAPGSMCESVFCTDPGLNQHLISNEGSATISRFFDQDEWERHRSVGRYWRHMFSAHKSTVFLRVLEPVLLMSAVAALVAAWNTFMTTAYALPALCIVPLVHQLTGGVVSLSLVFRTNNANRRVIDARRLLGNLSKCTRDMTRISQYIPNERDYRLETLRHLRAFPYALEYHVRKGRIRPNVMDRTSFGVDPMPSISRAVGEKRARRLTFYENVPAQVLMDMSQILQNALTTGMSTQMHAQAEIILKELSAVLAESEKILYTPIPISFTRHTSRILTMWLFTLPFSLWLPLGWCMIPAVFFISWVMLGVDEIGIEIEEPFGILPVRPLCDMCDREIVGAMTQALQAPDHQPARK